jgi:hypothetical protein
MARVNPVVVAVVNQLQYNRRQTLMPRLCFYVTSHGFGHGARVQAVVERLLAEPDWTIEVRSSVPRELFAWLLQDRCRQTARTLEPGVVQLDSVRHDLAATLHGWREHLAQAPALVASEAAHLRASGAALVVSDPSPVACAAARTAGLPVLLLGNFTWDWILEEYTGLEPGFAAVVTAIRELQSAASAYLRLPMSVPSGAFASEIEVPLVARQPRRCRGEVRAQLGVNEEQILILLSFGGLGLAELHVDRAAGHDHVRYLWDRGPARPPYLLSAAGLDLHYPDLIGAADLVLTKPGYGIFSEAIAACTPVAFIPRSGFREAPVLESYLQQNWPCLRLPTASLADGSWVESALSFLDAAPPCPVLPSDGARHVVELIRRHLQQGASR